MTNAGKNFLNEVITGDEAWCFAYDSETMRQVFEWVVETFHLPIKRKFQIFSSLKGFCTKNSYQRENSKCRML